MGLIDAYLPGQTPLDEDEKDGLLIQGITTRGELDEHEQLGIEDAMVWTMRKRFTSAQLFSEKFICDLHRNMFKNIWKWAGEFRRSNKNIGVDKYQIGLCLKQLLDDGAFWHQNGTFPPDELVIRFKHRLVNIHCFPNGNGRHSRLVADVLVSNLFRLPVYSWGGADIAQAGSARKRYLEAIWAGDKGDIAPLLTFARS